MISIGDLQWGDAKIGLNDYARIPGTEWCLVRGPYGYLAFRESMFGFPNTDKSFEDDVSLQCWLTTLTDGGNDVPQDL